MSSSIILPTLQSGRGVQPVDCHPDWNFSCTRASMVSRIQGLLPYRCSLDPSAIYQFLFGDSSFLNLRDAYDTFRFPFQMFFAEIEHLLPLDKDTLSLVKIRKTLHSQRHQYLKNGLTVAIVIRVAIGILQFSETMTEPTLIEKLMVEVFVTRMQDTLLATFAQGLNDSIIRHTLCKIKIMNLQRDWSIKLLKNLNEIIQEWNAGKYIVVQDSDDDPSTAHIETLRTDILKSPAEGLAYFMNALKELDESYVSDEFRINHARLNRNPAVQHLYSFDF